MAWAISFWQPMASMVHDAALEMEHPDQFRQRGNLVALLLNSQLARTRPLAQDPGADHVHWAVRPGRRQPKGLAVQRYPRPPGIFSRTRLVQPQEGFLEGLRVEHLENPG